MPTTKRLVRIGPMQLGKMMGALYGALGLVFVPLFGLFSLIIAVAAPKTSHTASNPGVAMFAGFGLVLMICLPIFYAVMGFVGGLVSAVIYNLFAKWIGGIEVEVE